MENSDFYIRLISDSSHEFFPQNVKSEFKTKLAKEEVLIGQWQVALCNIFYPRNWVNVAKQEEGLCTLFVWEKQEGARGNVSYIKRLNLERHLEPGCYSTPGALISAIYEQYRFLTKWSETSGDNNEFFSLSEVLDISHDVSTNKLSFAIKENAYSCHGISLTFSSKLLDMMGHVEYTEQNSQEVRNMSIDVALSGPSPRRKTLNRTTDLATGIYNLFVYSSLVQNTSVGDTQAPLLRIIPVRGDVGEYLYETFDDRQYIPLQSHAFQTIDMLIGDRFGNRIQFNHGSAPLILVLHFKRVS